MPLLTKWIDILYNVATGSRRVRYFFTPIGAIFYGLLIFAFVIMALHVDGLIGLPIYFQDSLTSFYLYHFFYLLFF
jgi:hypothetical protein